MGQLICKLLDHTAQYHVGACGFVRVDLPQRPFNISWVEL